MQEIDPYKPPEGRVEDPVDLAAISLATRGKRLAGASVDLLFYGVAAAILVLVVGAFTRESMLTDVLVPGYAGISIIFVINLYLLHQNGQTLGKKIVGTRIVMTDGSRAGLARIFVLRMLAPGMIGWVPYIGFPFGLADTLFIFREDRRCLHDLMAGTMVVVA
jgi:uncharacterized RDD family membrane protein YckC